MTRTMWQLLCPVCNSFVGFWVCAPFNVSLSPNQKRKNRNTSRVGVSHCRKFHPAHVAYHQTQMQEHTMIQLQVNPPSSWMVQSKMVACLNRRIVLDKETTNGRSANLASAQLLIDCSIRQGEQLHLITHVRTETSSCVPDKGVLTFFGHSSWGGDVYSRGRGHESLCRFFYFYFFSKYLLFCTTLSETHNKHTFIFSDNVHPWVRLSFDFQLVGPESHCHSHIPSYPRHHLYSRTNVSHWIENVTRHSSTTTTTSFCW